MTPAERFNSYLYNVEVVDNYDGDTITMHLDLGVGAWLKNQQFRLYEINTPEIHGDDHERAIQARDRLNELINDNPVVLETIEDRTGKYGRFLARFWIKDGTAWVSVNDRLVKEGLAEYADYD